MTTEIRNCVTQTQLATLVTQLTTEEANFRSRLETRLEAQHTHIRDELSEIKRMVMETNGRTTKNGENIAVLQRELDAIKSVDSETETLVNDIRVHGCAQLAKHEEVATAAGNSMSARRKAAIAGGLVGTGALIWPAIQQIAEAVHAIMDRPP